MPLIDIHIPFNFLIYAAMVFAVGAGCLMAYILLFLLNNAKNKQHYQTQVNAYSSFISEIILCDDEEEKATVLDRFYQQPVHRKWLSKESGRYVLTRQLAKAHKSMYGQGAENIEWLYLQLKLYDDTLKRFASSEWHVKALAIQELAEMKQHQSIKWIYKATNHKNVHVRNEAQIAVVKLTGFNGLRFLSVLSHTLSQWQQIYLLDQLTGLTEFNETRFLQWMHSTNDSIVEFCLRLIQRFCLYDFHDLVIEKLLHPSASIRQQAARSLREIYNDHTASIILPMTEEAPFDIKEELYALLQAIGSPDFLKQIPISEPVKLAIQ